MSKRMNPIRKSMVFSALLVSVLMIVTVILYLIGYVKNEGDSLTAGGMFHSPTGILAGILIFLAVGVFTVTLLFNMRKNKNVAKLNAEYEIVFDQITQYIGSSSLTLLEKRELNNEILALFLEAQNNKKDVEKVIGSDYQSFTNNMIEAYGVKCNPLHGLFTSIQYLIFYLIAAQMMMAIKDKVSYFRGSIDYTTLLFFVLISFIVLPALFKGRQTMIKYRHQNLSAVKGLGLLLFPLLLVPMLVTGCFILSIEVLTKYFKNISWISLFLNGNAVIIPSPVVLGFLLLLTATLYYVKRKMSRIQP